MADVRVNEVSTEMAVADASAFLSPDVLDKIVAAVIARLAGKDRDDAEAERERTMGSER